MANQKTAVIVFHGMGQQVPFETMGNVAERIRTHPDFREAMAGRESCAQNVKHKGAPAGKEALIPRIRMSHAKNGEPGADDAVLDVYEAYWASITAGKISSLDSLMFLMDAGITGIRFTFQRAFSRYFWHGKHEFKLPVLQNVASLVIVMLLISGLTAAGSRLWFAVQGSHSLTRPFEELAFLFRALHILAVPILAAFLFGPGRKSPGMVLGLIAAIALALAQTPYLMFAHAGKEDFWLRQIMVHNAHGLQVLKTCIRLDVLSFGIALIRLGFARMRKEPASLFGLLIWQQAMLACFAIIAGGACSAWFTWKTPAAPGSLVSGLMLYPYALIGVLVLAVLRGFLIEYVGDLAAYLSAHKASKFCQIRNDIQDEAYRTAAHVYSSDYANVLLVGHSLGSVIAYDTLNGLINYDFGQGKNWQVVERTKLLLTFGSPLDKVAFIFRMQVEKNDLRELLAASKQPLLEDGHSFRPSRWINIWSANDIISGPLDFYDKGKVRESADKKGARFRFDYFPNARKSDTLRDLKVSYPDAVPADPGPRPAISLVDPEANIPFAAHTQYWDNKLIYDVLISALNECLNGGSFAAFLAIDQAGGGS